MTEADLPRWKVRLINRLRKKRPNAKVNWVRIGKCASCSTKQCLKSIERKGAGKKLGAWQNIGHCHHGQKDEITFAVIRDPVDRICSYIRYKLHEKDSLLRVPEPARTKLRGGASMDKVVESLSDEWLLKPVEYGYYENVDIYLLIDEVPNALKLLLGLRYKPELLMKNNTNKHTSVRNAPFRDSSTIERVKRVRSSDYKIWKQWGER